MMIPEVIYADIHTKNSKSIYTLKCSINKRKKVINKVIQLLDILNVSNSHKLSYKSSIGIIDSNDYEIIVKPVIKNKYEYNEQRLSQLYKEHTPNNIIFTDGSNQFLLENVSDVINRTVSTKRDKVTHKVKKEDICVVANNKNIPISIKMTGGNTFWESADGILNHRMVSILKSLIDEYKIKDFDGRKLTHDIIIDNHNIDLSSCIFGSDILPNGCVIVTNFDDYRFINGSLYVYCTKVINDHSVMTDDIFKPVPIISKCKNRNKLNPLIKNLVTKVATNSRAKNAIKLSEISKMSDFYDPNKQI